MYPFIALLWDSNATEVAIEAQGVLATIRTALPGYKAAFAADGLVVLHATPADVSLRIYPLRQTAGVILGRVFPTDMQKWHADWSWSPSTSESAEIVRTRGQWLVQHMWGSYIALVRDPLGTESFAIRDCSGRLPCYRLRHLQIDILFSDPADLSAAGLIRTTLDWSYVCAFLCASQLQTRATGLEGITELLAGDCFHRVSAADWEQYCAWTPASGHTQPLISRYEVAIEKVRTTTIACVGAWASTFPSILHHLSGGLDSTVVLACLTESRRVPSIVCVNNFGLRDAEDERPFARLAASAADVKLVEIPMIAEDMVIDESLTRLPLTAKPTIPGTIGTLGIAAQNALAQQFGASSIWTGQGGDHLFMQTSLPLGPIDYAFLNGYRPAVLSAIRDAVHLSGLSYWRVASLLWTADLGRVSRALNESRIAEQPFLSRDLRPRAEYLEHPWMANADSLPPGRCLQIAALAEVLNRHRPLPNIQTTYEHHPLLSQPLLELCLRIPSYLHLRTGIDRAVERGAFAELIPKQIAFRRQKGQSTFSILETIHRSNRYLRELLLGGILGESGFLDKPAIEPYLEGHRPLDLRVFFPFLSCIAAELWIRASLNSGLVLRPRTIPPACDRPRS